MAFLCYIQQNTHNFMFHKEMRTKMLFEIQFEGERNVNHKFNPKLSLSDCVNLQL